MSNIFIIQKAQETGINEDQLNNIWKKAEDLVAKEAKSSNDRDPSSPMFTKKVIEQFNKIVDAIDIEEARYVMITREDYMRNTNEFLNNILDNDYGKADEHFGKMVDARLRLMINKERDNFYKDVLSKKAAQLASGD